MVGSRSDTATGRHPSRRALTAICVVAAVVAGPAAPSAPAAPVGSAGPTPVRDALPLDQSSKVARAGTSLEPGVRRVTPAPVSATVRDAGGDGAQELIAYVLSAVALALVAATALTLRRGRPPFPPATPRALLERHRNPDAARAAARPARAGATGQAPSGEGAARRTRPAPPEPASSGTQGPDPAPVDARPSDEAPARRKAASASVRAKTAAPEGAARAEPTITSRDPDAAPTPPASPPERRTTRRPRPETAAAKPPSSTPARDARPRGTGGAKRKAASTAPPRRPAQRDGAAAKPKPRRASAGPAAPGAPRAAKRTAPAEPSGGVAKRPAAPRVPAAENAAVCQIEWLGKGQGSCFSAVTVDARGGRHSLATSRRVEWRGSTPPDASPESRAALRQLTKILRDNGWQPIPGNGEDHGQGRWYARRFRRPAASRPSGAKAGDTLS